MVEGITIAVADIAAPLAVGLILWVLKSSQTSKKEIVGSVNALSVKVGETNGRMGKLEIGLESHIKQDDERHDNIQREQNGMWQAIGKRKTDHV